MKLTMGFLHLPQEALPCLQREISYRKKLTMLYKDISKSEKTKNKPAQTDHQLYTHFCFSHEVCKTTN